MNTLLQAAIDVGGDYEGQFKVYGYEAQGVSAADFVGKNRSVRCFYSQGNFPKGKGSLRGPMAHEPTYNMDLIVAEESEVDLSAFTDPDATDADRMLAQLNLRPAAIPANASFDELAEYVFQIFMDARNQDLGLSKYSIGSRWIQTIVKDPPVSDGSRVVITGSMTLTCEFDEEVTGATPKAAVSTTTTFNTINGDDVQQTAVESDFEE
jgi:hypothetical protein